jgi:hypothetical protein
MLIVEGSYLLNNKAVVLVTWAPFGRGPARWFEAACTSFKTSLPPQAHGQTLQHFEGKSMSLRKRPCVTAKMIAANRANARKSTGPRTEEGKKRVRFNGLRHGQRARSIREAVAAMGGNIADFDSLVNCNIDLFAPETLQELKQAEREALEEWLEEHVDHKTIFFSTD